MMRQFMLNIPNDYIDQARIDGAGEIELIFRVIFPLCTQAAVALAIFVFIGNWDQLFWPLLVLRDKDMWTVPQALYSIQGEMGTFYHLILAGATLAIIPPLLVYLFFQDKIVQGITLTGLKG
jgi:multiple sugar transport system permease protein